MSQPSSGLPHPQTLQAWRRSGWETKESVPRDVWDHLEDLLSRKRLTLWKKSQKFRQLRLRVYPPDDNLRLPDTFAYPSRYQKLDDRPIYDQVKAIQCPARTSDHRDVLIRLVAMGDQGHNHLKVLRRLAAGKTASLPENHAVPVLQEIEHEDKTFVVFPLMAEGFEFPWYYNFGEVIDAVYQIVEGIKFCHDHLVAHLDLDADNILINFVGGSYQAQDSVAYMTRFAAPFRQDFPVQYYLNDFELAVCYEEDSDPSTRLVRGLPSSEVLEGEYGRDPAPEMLLDAPYCPFRADMWQLGKMFYRYFGHLGDHSGPLVELYIQMMDDEPNSRPTAAQTFERVRQLRSEMSQDELESRVVRPPQT